MALRLRSKTGTRPSTSLGESAVIHCVARGLRISVTSVNLTHQHCTEARGHLGLWPMSATSACAYEHPSLSHASPSPNLSQREEGVPPIQKPAHTGPGGSSFPTLSAWVHEGVMVGLSGAHLHHLSEQSAPLHHMMAVHLRAQHSHPPARQSSATWLAEHRLVVRSVQPPVS